MLYVLPRGTKVTARKSEDGHQTVRNFKLNEQLTFGDEDVIAEQESHQKALVFNNGAWSLTAQRKDVQTY